MKKLKQLLLLGMLISFNGIKAQSITIDSKKLPYPTIENIITWTEYSLSDFKKEMSHSDFSSQGVSQDGANYVRVNLFKNNSLANNFTFEKYMGKKIKITYIYYDNKPILDDFIDELSPYFIKSYDGGLIEYNINYNSYIYRIIVGRTDTIELLRIERF